MRPTPMNEFNQFGLIVLTPMPEPIEESKALAITFTPNSGGPQYYIHPGETLSFEVVE